MVRFFALVALFALCFVSSAGALDSQVVVSQGVGSTVESAAQNAAQNALREVVGAFIDTTQRVQKRAEITDGIRSETKNISSDITQYSQGSIKSFKILDKRQDNGLWTVEAEVEVRVEDFKAYIKKVASVDAEVKLDVLVAMASDVEQEENINRLLIQPLTSIISGEVIDITVKEPERFSTYIERGLSSTTPGLRQATGELEQKLKNSGWRSSHTLAIPVKSSIRREFLANLAKKLDSTATAKRTEESLLATGNTFFIGIGPVRSRPGGPRLFDFFTLPLTNVEPLFALQRRADEMRLNLLDVQGAILMSHKFSITRGGTSYPFSIANMPDIDSNGQGALLLSTDGYFTSRDAGPFSFVFGHIAWEHLGRPASGAVRVLADREGVIFVHLSPQELSQVQNLQLTYSQSSDPL